MTETLPSRLDSFDTPDDALLRCVDRLERLIDAETAALRAGERFDIEAHNLRKTHAMLEFAHMTRNNVSLKSESVERRLRRLRERLALNAGVLDLHLRAMTEISELMLDSIRKDESYGAYSRGDAMRR